MTFEIFESAPMEECLHLRGPRHRVESIADEADRKVHAFWPEAHRYGRLLHWEWLVQTGEDEFETVAEAWPCDTEDGWWVRLKKGK